MPLLIILLGIIALLLLSLKKINPFLSLLVVSLGVGLGLGMPFQKITTAIQNGVGSTLGSMALVLALGAMFGKLLAMSGAALQITHTLVARLGTPYIQWAVVLAGFLIGIPLFYNAGFVILVPLIFSIATHTRLPLLYIALPMAAALSVTHGFLPPHPGPLALAATLKADVGKVLLYGLVLAVPTVILAGPVFGQFFKRFETAGLAEVANAPLLPEGLPSKSTSFGIALLPVLLISLATLAQAFTPRDQFAYGVWGFIGDPMLALLLSVGLGLYFLGLKQGKTMAEVMQACTESVAEIAMIVFIIGAGGAFKQVLVDSGTGAYITQFAQYLHLPLLVLAWLVAALLRLTLGSATVAGITAAGIIAPLLTHSPTSPELLVLAIGAGSLMFSHVNDTGFWMFKEYFNLSIQETIRSWSLMETLVSVLGLFGVLILQRVLGL